MVVAEGAATMRVVGSVVGGVKAQRVHDPGNTRQADWRQAGLLLREHTQ